MASLNLNQLRTPSTVKSTAEAVPRQSNRPFLGNGTNRQPAPSQFIRTGENFNHLKLTAEKMMQEQAGVKSDLLILKTKLQKSEDQVRTLESKVQDMNNDNAMLKAKHKQEIKLWKGLDSKLLSTTTFCDQLAETLQLLDCQVQEADRSKTFLEEKLAERLEFFECTESRLLDLLEKKEAAEKSVTQCEASNAELHCTIREMERRILSNTDKVKKLADEKDGLQQELTKAKQTEEENRASVLSTRCKIEDLQNQITCSAKEAIDLQHLNLTLMQGKGGLELEVKGLQSHLDTTLKDNEALRQELELIKLKITDLEKVNAVASVNNQNLIAEKAKLELQNEAAEIAHGKKVDEFKQYRVQHEMDVEVFRTQLQEAIKENERLANVLGEEQSKFTSLQDEINRLYQERIEKTQLISCISQNVESLTRENSMIQDQLTAAEDFVKSLEVKSNLELEFQREESSRRVDDMSQRHNQEIADVRRNFEAEMKKAIAKEKIKGEDAWKAVKQASDDGMAKELEAFDKRRQNLQENCELRIRTLREGHEEDNIKIAAIHADELHKRDEDLNRVNEKIISKILHDHEEEKKKLVSTHSDEINKMQAELQKLKETMSRLKEGQREKKTKISSDQMRKIEEERQIVKKTISELQESHEQEKTKIIAIHSDEIHKTEKELHKMNDMMSKLQEIHEQEKTKIVSIHSDKIQKTEIELRKMNEMISKLQESHEQEKTKIVSFHSDEILKTENELRKMNEMISKLQESHEQEKTKIVSIHSDEIHKTENELREMNEMISKLQESHEQEKTKIVSIHSDEIHKTENELRKMNEMISKLQESHEQEKTKIVSFHSDEIHKTENELRKMNEMIRKLREGHEQEKKKVVALHNQGIHKMQEELRREQEKYAGSVAELQDFRRTIVDTGLSNRETMDNLHLDYQIQLQKISEEKSELHLSLKEMQLSQEELLIRKTQEHKAHVDKLGKDRHAQIRAVQESLNHEINEWQSKALRWEIQLKEALQQLKEALQQIATKQVSKEGTLTQIVDEDFKTTITEEPTSKDLPTPIVTPITKDKETQQPNQKLTVKRIIHLADTTDEEDNQKQKQKAQGQVVQSPRPGKRKVDVMSTAVERVSGRTSRRKGTLDIHKKAIQQHQTPAKSPQAAEDGNKMTSMKKDNEPQKKQVILRQHSMDQSQRKTGFICTQESGSSGNKMTSMKKDNEPQKKQVVLRQHSIDQSQRKTGVICTQESDLHPMPGPTKEKEQRIDPKRKLRKSTEDVSQEIKRFTKELSPAISDLFQMDDLVPYYQGDDPYAFD